MNNYERIKNMSIDEMAEWMAGINNLDCYDCPCYDKGDDCNYCKEQHKQWLQEEV